MDWRANKRSKDGKEHRYGSVEESRRLRSGRVVQRRVLYLGEINDSQQAAWRKTLEVFDEAEQRAASLSLFPKERAMRRRKLVRLWKTLRKLRRSAPARDQLLLRIGAAKKEAGRAFGFVPLHLPREGEEVTRQTFSFHLDREKLQKAELRDGHYLLRSNLLGEKPEVLWELYILLTQIEAAFRTLKSELGLRPIYHQGEKRVEAHIFVAFLAYALSVTLRQRLAPCAPGLTPRAVLEKLATIQMLDVCFPTTDGRWLIMPRYTQPEPEQMLLLHQLHLSLPSQPPPRIKLAETATDNLVQLKM